jgi:hypothetical protein
MILRNLLTAVALGIALALSGHAQSASSSSTSSSASSPTSPASPPFPTFVYAAEGGHKIIEYNSNGGWEYPAEMSRDAWKLPNGNVLFCYNLNYDGSKNDNPSGVMEVTPDKKVVFHFQTTGQVWSCQRLADGNTLVGAASQGKLLLVSPELKIVHSITLSNTPGHSCLRNARQIPNGHFLVAEESARAAREYARDGTLIREIKVDFAPYSALRLENGDTVLCGEKHLVKINARNETTWSLSGDDLPEMGIRWFAGIQALPNGNLFVCNAGGKIPFLEIAPDKKVVWHSPEGMAIPFGHGIHRFE